MNKYCIQYKCSDENGKVFVWTSNPQTVADAGTLRKEYEQYYTFDPQFSVLSVWKDYTNCDYLQLLSKSMNATQHICSLGNKIRATNKLKNRQPLKSAFLYFSDEDVLYYINSVHLQNKLDGKKLDYFEIIKDELNVLDIKLISKEDISNFLQISLKVNYKKLGPKLSVLNKGSLNKEIKNFIDSMSQKEQEHLYNVLLNNSKVNLFDFDFSLEDFEVNLNAKENFVSASDKNGVLILDTSLNDQLISLGFMREFRSAAQNLRKELKLDLTQKVLCHIYTAENFAIETILKYKNELSQHLLVSDFLFYKSHNELQAATGNIGNNYSLNDKEVIIHLK